MKKSYPFSFICTLLLCTAVSALSAYAQHANVAGTWNLSVETGIGSGTPTFVFQHEMESAFVGTYAGQLGKATVKGKVKGNEVQFEFSIDGNLIEYKGTVEGNNMKGTLTLGTVAEGTFTGKRKTE